MSKRKPEDSQHHFVETYRSNTLAAEECPPPLKVGKNRPDLLESEEHPQSKAEDRFLDFKAEECPSLEDEDLFLSLAAEARLYPQVQLIAFNIKPSVGSYLGNADSDEDINARCRIMMAAVKAASLCDQVDKAVDVLKVFMAPEFYFRGAAGGYPIEKISDILGRLRQTTDDVGYEDWLFVFGTAIGYLKHEEEHEEEPGTRKQYDAEVIAVGTDLQGQTQITVQSKVCSRIPATYELQPQGGAFRWEVEQSSVRAEIVSCVALENDDYLLTLEGPNSFDTETVTLLEPIATEVFNVALVKKGYPEGSSGLTEALIYKEYVSAIDFLGSDGNTFDDRNGRFRKITIHGKNERTVLPSEGSRDLLGASPNAPPMKATSWEVGSEVNKSGLGGGSVFTMGGITFGLEVCLDHAKNRLADYYESHAAPGDPKVQIQLIPSCGMSIGGGKICCVPNGLVFNVDGIEGNSEVQVNKEGTTGETVNPVGGPVFVQSEDVSTYFEQEGHILVYPVHQVPQAAFVQSPSPDSESKTETE